MHILYFMLYLLNVYLGKKGFYRKCAKTEKKAFFSFTPPKKKLKLGL